MSTLFSIFFRHSLLVSVLTSSLLLISCGESSPITGQNPAVDTLDTAQRLQMERMNYFSYSIKNLNYSKWSDPISESQNIRIDTLLYLRQDTLYYRGRNAYDQDAYVTLVRENAKIVHIEITSYYTISDLMIGGSGGKYYIIRTTTTQLRLDSVNASWVLPNKATFSFDAQYSNTGNFYYHKRESTNNTSNNSYSSSEYSNTGLIQPSDHTGEVVAFFNKK